MDLHRLRVVEFDSLLSEKEGEKKNIAELGESKQEDCKTLSSDGNDNEIHQLESDKIFLRGNASPPESSKISSFVRYKSNSEIFNNSPKDKLRQSELNVNTIPDVKKSFQDNLQKKKKRTINLFNKKARNKGDKEMKVGRKENEEVHFLFARETPSFIRYSRKRAKNERANASKVVNDVFGFQENRSVDPNLYQTSCNYLNIDKLSFKKIKKGFCRKPKPAKPPKPVRDCFCKHHAMRILTSAVTGSGKKDDRPSIYYNLNMHSCQRRTRHKRNSSLYEEVWARDQPIFLAKDKNVEVSPSSLVTIAKSYCNANVGPSQIERTSCSQRPPSATHPRRNKLYPQHSTPSPSSESNGPDQYQSQVVNIPCKRKRTNVKKIFSLINNQRTKLFSGFFQRVNAFHIKNNASGKKCIKYAFFGLLIVVWSPCLLAVILAWAVMCPVRLTNMLNTNKTKGLLPVLSSFVNKFRKKTPRSDYDRMCFGDYSYQQTKNCRTSTENWYARAAHTVVNSYNALLSMFKIRNKPPTCAGSSFLTSSHPNPKKRYTLFYANNRGWMMKPARRSNARSFPGSRVVQTMRCEFRPKFWRKSTNKCPNSSCNCSKRGAKKNLKTVSTEKGQMKVRSSQKLCCDCPPPGGPMKEKIVSNEKAQMKTGSSQKTTCDCLAHGKISCDCPASRKLSCECLAHGIISCDCLVRGKITCDCPASRKISCECLTRGNISCDCQARGKVSCDCLARGKITCDCPASGKIACDCLARGITSCKCLVIGTVSCDCPLHGAKGGIISCKCPAGGTAFCKCPARGTVSCKCPVGGPVSCFCPVHGDKGRTITCKCPAGGTILNKIPERGTITCKCPAGGTILNKIPERGTISCKCPVGGTVSCDCPVHGAKGGIIPQKSPVVKTIPQKSAVVKTIPQKSLAGGTKLHKSPVLGTISCKCPVGGTVSCDCPVHGAKGGSIPQKSPVGGTTPKKSPASGSIPQKSPASGTIAHKSPAHGTITCKCPDGGTVSCDCPVHGAKGGTISQKSPVGGTIPQKSPVGGTIPQKSPAHGTITCKCPEGGTVSCDCPVHGAKGGTVICECPVLSAKNVQKNAKKLSAAGDYSPVLPKAVVECLCKDVMNKESVECMCPKSSKSSKSSTSSVSSTKYFPQRKQVNILQTYFYPTSGVQFNSTIYQTAQTKPNNLNSINISDNKQNDFAKYRLSQRKNGTLPFGVVVECGTKHPLIMNKETYGTHSFGLAGKTLKMSTKYISTCNKKYFQGQSSTRTGTKNEPSTNCKKTFNIHRSGVPEITKTVLSSKFSPQLKRNRSRGHSSKYDIALNCPCGRKNHNTSITDQKVLGNSSRERLRNRNKSVLTRLSQAVLTKQAGTNTYKINHADKTQSISNQTLSQQVKDSAISKHILGQNAIGKSQNNPKHTPSQKVKLVKNTENPLQPAPLHIIKALNCPCKNERSVGTEMGRPKSNKEAVDCRCNTENKSSTPAKILPAKQPVSKCACKDETITKKEEPRPEYRLPNKKTIECGCTTKTLPNTGKGSAIQIALNCPCKNERSVGTETGRLEHIIVSDNKAVDCCCNTEKKSSTLTKDHPPNQLVSKCACKDVSSTKKEETRQKQRLPNKNAIDCGCMTKTQPDIGKAPAIQTALNCPCNDRSVGSETGSTEHIVSNKKAVDCRCSTENKPNTAAKEHPSKQPVSKCACKDDLSTKKENSHPEKSFPDKKVVDCGCMTEKQLNTGKSLEKKPNTAAKEHLAKQPVSKCACKDEPSTKKEEFHSEQRLLDHKAIDCGCRTEIQPKTGKGSAIQTALNCPCKNERSVGTETGRPEHIVPNKKGVDCRCRSEKKPSTAAKDHPSKQLLSKCACKDDLSTKKEKPGPGQSFPNNKAVDCDCITAKQPNISKSLEKKPITAAKQPVSKCACKDEPSTIKEEPRPEQRLPDKKAIDCGCMTETQPNTGKGSAIQTALNCPCNERSVVTDTGSPEHILSNKKAVDCRCSTEKKSSTAVKEHSSKQPLSKCACKDELITKKEKSRPEQSFPDKKAVDCGCMTGEHPNIGKSLDKKPITAAKEHPVKQPISKCACKDESSRKKEEPRPEQRLPDKKTIDCGCMTESQQNTGKYSAKQNTFNCPCKSELSVGTETVRPERIVFDKKTVDCRCSAEKKPSTAAKELSLKEPVSKCACKYELSAKKEKPRPEQRFPDKKAIDCDCMTETQSKTSKYAAKQTAFNCPCKYEPSVGTETVRPEQIASDKKTVDSRTENKPSTAAKQHVQCIVTDSETNTSGYQLKTKSLEQLSLKVNVSEDHSLKCKTALWPSGYKDRPTAISSEIKIPSESLKQLNQTNSSSIQVPIRKKITAVLKRSVLTQKVSKSTCQSGESTNDCGIGPSKQFKTTTVDNGYGTTNHPSTTMVAHPIQHQKHDIETAEEQVLLTQRVTKCRCSKKQPPPSKKAAICGCWPKNSPTGTTANKTGSLDKLQNESTTPLSNQGVTNNNKQQQTQPTTYDLAKQISSQQANGSQFGVAINCPCGNDREVVSNQETIRQPSPQSNGIASKFARKTQSQIATDNNNVKLKSRTAEQSGSFDKPPNQLLNPLSSQPVINNNKQQQTQPSYVISKQGSNQQVNESQFGVALNCPCGNETDVVSTQETSIRQPLNQSHRIDPDSVLKTQPQIAADNNNTNLKSPSTATTANQTGLSDKPPSVSLKPLSSQLISNNRQHQTEPSYVIPKQHSSQLYGIAPDCACQTQPQTAVDNNIKPKIPSTVTTANKTSSIDKTQSEILKLISSQQVIKNNQQQQGQLPTYGLSKQASNQQAKNSLFGVALNCPCGKDTEIIKTQETGISDNKNAYAHTTDIEKNLSSQRMVPKTQKQSKASECACEIKSRIAAEHRSTRKTGLEEKYPSQQSKTQKESKASECACEIKSEIKNDSNNTYNNTHKTGSGEKLPVQHTKSLKTQSRSSRKPLKSFGKTSDFACGSNQPLLNDKRSMHIDESGLAENTPSKQVKFTQNQPPVFGIATDCPCENATDKKKDYNIQYPSSTKTAQTRSAHPPSKTTKNGIYPPNRHTQTQSSIFGISSDCVCETYEPIDTVKKTLRSRISSSEHLSKAPIHPLSHHKRATQTQSPIPQELQELSDYPQSRTRKTTSHLSETSLEQQRNHVQADTKCTCKHKSSITWCKKRAIKCICQTKKEMHTRPLDKALSKADTSSSRREMDLGKQSSCFNTKSDQPLSLTKKLSECACEFQKKQTPAFKKVISSRNSAITVKSQSHSPLISCIHTKCKCSPEKSRSNKSRFKLFGYNKNQQPQVLPIESACPCSQEKLNKILSKSEKNDRNLPRKTKNLKQSSKRLCKKPESSCPPSLQLPSNKLSRHTSKFSRLIMTLRSKFSRSKKSQQSLKTKLSNHKSVHLNPIKCACPVSNTSSQLKLKQVGKPSRSFFQRLSCLRSPKSKTSQTKSYRSYLSHVECGCSQTECGCTVDKVSSSKSQSRSKTPRSLSRYSRSSKKLQQPSHSECHCSIKKTYSKGKPLSKSEKKSSSTGTRLRVNKSYSKSQSSSFASCPVVECRCRDKNNSSSQHKLHPKLFKGNKKQQSKSPNSSIVMSFTPMECICSSGDTSSTQNGEKFYHSLKTQSQQHKILQFPSLLHRSRETFSARKVFNNSQQTKPNSQYFTGQQTVLTQFPSPLHNTTPMPTNSTKNLILLSDSIPQRHSRHMLLSGPQRNGYEKISRSLQTAPIIPGKCACLPEKLRSQPTPSKEQLSTDLEPKGRRKTTNNSKDSDHFSSQIASNKEKLPSEPVSLSTPIPAIESEKSLEFSQQLSTPQSDLPKQDSSYKRSQSKHLNEKLGNDIVSQQPAKAPWEKNPPQNPSQRYPNQHVMRPYPYDPSRPIVPIIPGMCTCAVKQRLSEYLRKIAQTNKPQQNNNLPEISDSTPGLHNVPTPPTDDQRVLSDTISHHSHKPTIVEGPPRFSQHPKQAPHSNTQPSPFAEEGRLKSDAVSNSPRKTMMGSGASPMLSQSAQSQHHEISKPLVTKQQRLSDTLTQHSQKPMLETDAQTESNHSHISSQPKPLPEKQQIPPNKLSHSLHKIPSRTEGSLALSHNRESQKPEIGTLGSPPIPSVEKQRLQQGSVHEIPRNNNIGTDGQSQLLHNLSRQQTESSRPFHDSHPTRIIPGKCTCSNDKHGNSLDVVANHIKGHLPESKLQPEPLHHLPYECHKMSNHSPQNFQQSHMISRVHTNSANKVPLLSTNAKKYSNIKGQTEKLLDMSRHIIVQRSEILQSPQNLQTSLQLKQILSVLKRNACECPTEESNISPKETTRVDKTPPGLLQRRSSGKARKGEAVSGGKQRSKLVEQQPYPDFNRVKMRYPARKRSEQSPGRKRTEHIPPPAKKKSLPAVGVSPPPNYARRPCYANPANKCGPKTCFDELALRRAYKRRPLRYTPPKQQLKSKKGLKQKKQSKKDKKREKQKRNKVVRRKVSRSGFNMFQCCQCVQELVNDAEKDAWPDEVTCRPIYIHALKRRPCFWIFKWFPSIYPAFLSCYKLQQNICQMCLYVIALCLWSPFILCFYVCFNLICKS